ncbi:F-box/LRR-repeat/kelch-repeat protein At1g09650-like [Eutrema salsugineum]|uniref:F-box/LRR-repeat/kelch-repeat protein At1g09650-like n=1 Tax=Eutrema salsugineum TaxID=72664 RepID=UPI000CED352A|nr:F-box/LRR-repeat/kelch-repeat protein At1g09650-like [Eutrema salsugineum]
MRLEWSSAWLVKEEEEYHIYDKPEDETVMVCTSLDGLVCFHGGTELKEPIRVINPATRWSQTLPLAKIQLEHLHIKVFDFGVKQWRLVIPPDHPTDHKVSPTFSNGWLYRFSQEHTKLVAFDLHMEMFQVVPNPIIDPSSSSSSSSSINMEMDSIDDERGLVWISVTNGDGMQHVWRISNHNTGGGLLKMYKMFSFELNKITSTWFEETLLDSTLLMIVAISKNDDKVMLSKSRSQTLILYQPLNPNSTL